MTVENDDRARWAHSGSICGETFASIRVRKSCTLRSHTIASVAAQLRNQSFDSSIAEVKKHEFNTSFHYYRFIVVMMAGLAIGLMYMMRYTVTVAMLKMVNHTVIYLEEHPNRTMDDFLAEGYLPGGEFHWNHEKQQMIMSSYMISYTLPQFIIAKYAKDIGSRIVMPLSLTICALSNIAIPFVAYYGWEWVLAARLINGVGASAVLPMFISCIESWMPSDQISLGLTFGQFTQSIITALIPIVSGYLAAVHWKWAFYIPSGVTIVFSIIWAFLVCERPDDNWLVSARELERICGCNDGHEKCNGNSKKGTKGATNNGDSQESSESVGLIQVMKQHSVYCYMIIWCIYCCTYSGFLFVLPTYMRQFLKITTAEVGFLLSIVQSGCLIAVLWPHWVLSFMQNNVKSSELMARRVAYLMVCSVLAGTFLYIGTFHQYQLLLLFLNRCFLMSYDIIIPAALMVNYAGMSSLVFSVINTIGNLSTVTASGTIGWLLDYTGSSRQGWFWIFTTLGSIQFVGLAIFFLTISGGPIKFHKPTKMSFNIEEARVSPTNDGTIMNNFDMLKEGNLEEKKNEYSERKIV